MTEKKRQPFCELSKETGVDAESGDGKNEVVKLGTRPSFRQFLYEVHVLTQIKILRRAVRAEQKRRLMNDR